MPSIEQPLYPQDVLGSSRLPSTAVVSKPQIDLAEKYILRVLELYKLLSKLAKLEPSPQVNTIFGSLVSICAEIPNEVIAEAVVTDPRIIAITPHLRQLCSEGECLLEAYWAVIIGNFESVSQVKANLFKFPYYSNYVDLTRMEIHAIFSMLDTPPRKFAFIGSGPLPLTSLCIADMLEKEEYDSPIPLRIHNIDRDSQAISLSSALCQKLGPMARSMTFQCTEAVEESEKQDLREFDVVYLAALVGSTKKQKQDIIADVAGRMRVGGLLVLRSAHSLRSLLYPVIDAATDLRGSNLKPLLAVHPYNHIVNSVIIAGVIEA